MTNNERKALKEAKMRANGHDPDKVSDPVNDKKRERRLKILSNSTKRGSSLLSLVVCILLASCFIALLTGGTPKTFASLLETIQSCPTLDFTFLFDWGDNILITSDWEMFNFLRDFFNLWLTAFGGLWSFLFFLAQGLVNFILIVTWLLKWFFL